jgi:hypothetical protein
VTPLLRHGETKIIQFLHFFDCVNKVTPWYRSLHEKLIVLQPMKTFFNFMEPKGPSSCTQNPPTGPYPEPVQSRPHTHGLLLLRSILILSSHLHLDLTSDLFPSGFPIYTFLCISYLHHVYHMSCPFHLPLFNWPKNIK